MHVTTQNTERSIFDLAGSVCRSVGSKLERIYPCRTGWIIAVILGLLPLTQVSAAECMIDSSSMDRGERKQFYICSRDITPGYKLGGLVDANIKVTYDQFIRRCGVGDNRRGIFFWAEAEGDATTATISVTDANTGESLCELLPLTVPDRVPVDSATLTPSMNADSTIHLLQIKAAPGQNLIGACAEGIDFPAWGQQPSRWPTLTAVSSSDMDKLPHPFRNQRQPISCKKSSITALVRVNGQQREPAKIVISSVQLASGDAAEGVGYVSLPKPSWANSMSDLEAKFVNVDGIRTRYWDKGRGPALLLLHGGQPTGKAGGALTWVRNFDNLAKNFHVYAIDRIGQGLTDNLANEDDYKRYYEHVIDHVWGFINAVGIERVGLVGHSQGGWPVSRIALDHPDRVYCVVNVDSVLAPGNAEALHTARFYMNTIQFHPLEGETVESIQRTREFQSYTLNNITTAGAKRGYELARLPKLAEANDIMTKMNMNPRHPDAQALFEQARQDIVAGMLQVPSLVIWGYNDPSSPLSGGFLLFDVINTATPVSEMHVFNSSGHSSHVEHPEEFTRVVGEFCGRF